MQAPYHVNGSGPATITNASGYPRATGFTRPLNQSNSTGKYTNSTSLNTLCTVNVPSANLEWWYAATFYSAVGTYTQFAPNWTNYLGQYLTMVPNTKTDSFDVASAIENDNPYTEHVTYDSEYDMTWTDYVPYTVTPAAAATSVVELNNLPTLPPGNSFPASDLYTYLTAGSNTATVDIATVANATSAMTSNAPFIYFTAYEVEEKVNGTTVTKTINLPQPAAATYTVEGIENSASASGTVPANLMQQIPQSTCVPGTFQGTVTVLVVVELQYIYKPHVNPFIVHIESSVLGWDDNPVIVAAATSTDKPFTMANDPAPTQDGASPGSTPAGNGASASPRPGKIAPGQSQPGGQPGSGQSNSDAATTPRETVGTIGTNPVIVGPSSVVIVGSQTVQPGGPAVTIGGSAISVAPSATAIVVNGHTSPLPIVGNPGSTTQTIGTIGGSTVVVGPSSAVVGTIGGNPVIVGPSSVVVVGTQTLQPGGSVVIVNGSPVSLVPSGNAIVVPSTAPNGAIVGSQTSSLPHVIFPAQSAQAAAPPVLTIGSSTLTANAATQFFIAPGQTLTPGGTATVGGQLVSLGPSAAFVVVGGSTQILPTGSPSMATSRPEIVVGGTTITALPNLNPNNPAAAPTFVISGQTLLPGHTIDIAGTIISLPDSGSVAVINGVTSTLINAAPSLTVAGTVITPMPNPDASFTIDGQLLTPGGVITVSGTTISLSPGATALVVNGVTTLLGSSPPITNPPLLTIGTHTYTALPGTGTTFVIDGQTLTLGGTIVVDGTTISLSPEATQLVYGSAGRSTTEMLFPATTTGSASNTGLGYGSWPASAGATQRVGQAQPTESKKGSAASLSAVFKSKFVPLPCIFGAVVGIALLF